MHHHELVAPVSGRIPWAVGSREMRGPVEEQGMSPRGLEVSGREGRCWVRKGTVSDWLLAGDWFHVMEVVLSTLSRGGDFEVLSMFLGYF